MLRPMGSWPNRPKSGVQIQEIKAGNEESLKLGRKWDLQSSVGLRQVGFGGEAEGAATSLKSESAEPRPFKAHTAPSRRELL